ncbi:uncharacterized protein SAPINGB_P001454 [Magnusiomyces paraingens]|uniref:Uncharacterized protein n=1 Tax=Magnusiomyces paraingens TaxID=2606893 RepID=A0A5E8B7Y0_9ASCO|nr:uncharacterized protein SAPINGB_P001454 [Saprochaete ingens]VVT46922.1 unnamed protein product [Saprochaete ingens]
MSLRQQENEDTVSRQSVLRHASEDHNYYHRDHYTDWDSSYRRRSSSPFSTNFNYHTHGYEQSCSPSLFQVRLVTGAFSLFMTCVLIVQFFYQLNHKYTGLNGENPVVLIGLFTTFCWLVFYSAFFLTFPSQSTDSYYTRSRLQDIAPQLEDDPWNIDVTGNYIRPPNVLENSNIEISKEITLRKAVIGSVLITFINIMAGANFAYALYIYITNDQPPPPPPPSPPPPPPHHHHNDPYYDDPNDPTYNRPNTPGGNAFFTAIFFFFSFCFLVFSFSTLISKLKKEKINRALQRLREQSSQTSPTSIEPQVPPLSESEVSSANEESEPVSLPKYSTFDLGPPPSYSTFDNSQQ